MRDRVITTGLKPGDRVTYHDPETGAAVHAKVDRIDLTRDHTPVQITDDSGVVQWVDHSILF